VAILDLSIPQLSGIEVARRHEGAGLDTRIVLLTMHDDPSAVLPVQETGARDRCKRPASLVMYSRTTPYEELVQAVHSVAGGGTFVTP
jgi:DNA-binding NarL/FixJ family response regulator